MKFSVNSSLRANVRMMKPLANASEANIWLPVASLTTSNASTPIPTSMPPTTPVADMLGRLRCSRSSPEINDRWKARDS